MRGLIVLPVGEKGLDVAQRISRAVFANVCRVDIRVGYDLGVVVIEAALDGPDRKIKSAVGFGVPCNLESKSANLGGILFGISDTAQAFSVKVG